MRRKIILIIISILILTLSILGITYAFMRPQVEEKEEKNNITINACAKIQLKDNSNSINLENTYPLDDEMGLKTNPYEFTITSTCEDYVGFNLYLTSLITNEIEDSNIHFAIASQEGIVLVSDVLSKATNALTEFNTDELKELDLGIKGTHKNIYKVYSNNIPLKGESEYKLYLWVDKDASKETMGKSFKVGLSVKSYNREESLAEYLIKNKDNTLIYHDGLPDYNNMENSEFEAEDLSYRYVGSNPSNYVCLDSLDAGDCESDEDLYRIIGLFKNDLNLYETKLIKVTPYQEENISVSSNAKSGKGYYWSGSKTNYENSWKDSTLNTQILNVNFINSLDTNISSKIVGHSWIVQGNTYDNIINIPIYESYKNEIQNTGTKFNAKIGLLYVSDFGYSIPSEHWNEKNNDVMMPKSWLYLNDFEWTITPRTDYGNYAFFVDANQYFPTSYGMVHIEILNIRPTFYLKSDVKLLSGAGIKENPYRFLFDRQF